MPDALKKEQISEENSTKICLRSLFSAWFAIGFNSFGGGQSTLSLIQRKLATEKGWITDSDFAQANAMAQLAPGINLLAITILIGQQLGGILGVFVSLVGLLLPSVTVTIVMTAGFALVREYPVARDAFHAIVPATVGIGALTAFRMLYALALPHPSKANPAEISVCAGIVAASFILVWCHAPVIVVMIGGGLVLGVLHPLISRQTCETPLESRAE